MSIDPSRDNPLIRFASFWWGLATFFAFALILALVFLLNRKAPETLEDEAAKARYKTKSEVIAAQAASLKPEAIDAIIPAVAAKLAASKPAAVEKPEQAVPGSATPAEVAVAAAAPAAPASDTIAPAEATIDPAVMALGKTLFATCSACHGINGEGGALAPPLAKSEWVTGPVSNLIRIQLRGLKGPITVAGKEYNFPAGMAAFSYQTDEQIAAILTYARNSFGNKASAVTPYEVKALRSEVGKPQLTVQDLAKP